MGIDNYYRGLPAHSELLRLSQEDKDIAEDILFPTLLFDDPISVLARMREPRFRIVRELFEQRPEIKTWHLYAGRSSPYSFAEALYEASGTPSSDSSFEESLAYMTTNGERVFSDQFVSTTGFPVRVSSPEVVRKIAAFCRSIDFDFVPDSYRDKFVDLSKFYQAMSLHGDVAVFFMQN